MEPRSVQAATRPRRARTTSRGRILAGLVALTGAFSPAAAQSVFDCPPGNLVESARVTGERFRGAADVLQDGRLLPEAMYPDPQAVVVLADGSAYVEFDLGAVYPIKALVLQRDHATIFGLEGSVDGEEYQPLLQTPRASGQGQRTWAGASDQALRVRYLRLRPLEGPPPHTLAEFQVFCEQPQVWPPQLVPAGAGPGFIGRRGMTWVKIAVAVLALGLFVWGAAPARFRLGDRGCRLRDLALGTLAVVAALSWWNLGSFHGDHYLHRWEHYHYYLGAKYLGELGYGGLYPCTVIADSEDGFGERVLTRKLRDDRTNHLVESRGILDDPAACKDRFTPHRWESFKHDLSWFRSSIPPPRWETLFTDHGYNASPAWAIAAVPLANLVPATDGGMLALGLIDPLLLVVMWASVFRTFGWRVAAVGLIFWGTNDLAGFSWTGGALLRQDWLVLSIVGIGLVRRGRNGWGGFALTYATLLRVFPGFLIAALALRALYGMWRQRDWLPSPGERRFAIGCLVALVLLIPTSAAMTGGADGWTAFVENTRANVRSTGSNTVGLMTLLSFDRNVTMEAMHDPDLIDPHGPWLEAKRRIFTERRWAFRLFLLGFLVLLVRAVRHQPDWSALALGVGLVAVAAFPSNYYYAILVGYALLAQQRHNLIGAMLAMLALATQLASVALPRPIQYDRRYAWDSLAVVLVVLATTMIWARRRATIEGKVDG